MGCQRMLEPNGGTLAIAGALQASGHGLASMLSLTSCITGDVTIVAKPQFPHMKNGNNDTLKSYGKSYTVPGT